MKYFYFTLACLINLSCGNYVFASGAVAGATEPTQIVNHVELLGVNSSDLVTSIATTKDYINNTILKPITVTLINNAQQQMATQVVNWAAGGFQGQPMIISDPQTFFRNQSLGVVSISLNQIPKTGVFSNSIFSSVVNQNKDDPLGAKIAELTSSNQASIVQNNMCTDAGLTSLAQTNIQQNADGSYDPQTLAAEKARLYAYAECGTGNPKTDPKLETKLTNLGAQRPSIGLWDSWLALTVGGDNPEDKANKINTLVSQKAADAAKNANQEVFQGAGPVSQKKCVKYETVYLEGQVAQCLEWTTVTPGKTVNSSLSKAATAPLDRLTNLTGEGGLSSIIAAAVIAKLTAGVMSSLNSALSPSSSSGNSTSNTSNSVTTVSTKAPPTQDLADNPDGKTSLISPMLKLFSTYLDTLTALEAVDGPYKSDVDNYQSRISAGKSCYDSLVSGGASPNDPQISAGYAFYQNRQQTIDAINAVIVPEIANIPKARALVSTTTASINTSNSTEEIGALFSSYSATIDTNKYPVTGDDAKRKGEYEKAKNNQSGDTDVAKYESTCNQLKSQYSQAQASSTP